MTWEWGHRDWIGGQPKVSFPDNFFQEPTQPATARTAQFLYKNLLLKDLKKGDKNYNKTVVCTYLYNCVTIIQISKSINCYYLSIIYLCVIKLHCILMSSEESVCIVQAWFSWEVIYILLATAVSWLRPPTGRPATTQCQQLHVIPLDYSRGCNSGPFSSR